MDEKEYKDKEPEDYSDDYIRYGLITKKGGERSLDDSYMAHANIESVDNSGKKLYFSLFGIFDGHNNKNVSQYISNNIDKLYQKEIGNMNKNNYKTIIEEIFKTIDKTLKEKEQKDQNNTINEKGKESEKNFSINENQKYINIGVDEKEINLFKEIIKNSKEIPDDLKQIEDSQIKDLLLFRNLFKYNNNFLYNNNDLDYIGSSASIVLINDSNIITADLGITVCILFNKNGEIKNLKDSENNIKDLKELKSRHTFNNKEEKRRIKKFNQEINYNNLKLNIYLPASRCFGLFKYKKEEILKEENQIISCVPEINIYDKENIDFILLMTKGMIDLIGDNLKKFIEKIVNCLKEQNNEKNEIKLSKIIEEYIKPLELEDEKNNSNKKDTKATTKSVFNNKNQFPANKGSTTIYVGKDDFAEENIIINEINNNYYKDIMDMNKANDPFYNAKSNMTCILIQLFKNKKREENKEKNAGNKEIIKEELEKKENKENKLEEKIINDRQDNKILKGENNEIKNNEIKNDEKMEKIENKIIDDEKNKKDENEEKDNNKIEDNTKENLNKIDNSKNDEIKINLEEKKIEVQEKEEKKEEIIKNEIKEEINNEINNKKENENLETNIEEKEKEKQESTNVENNENSKKE